MSANDLPDAVRRHTDDLQRALAAYAGPRVHDSAAPAPAAAADSGDARLRERLDAAAEYTGLPPQILLPAQHSHDSPHRRG